MISTTRQAGTRTHTKLWARMHARMHAWMHARMLARICARMRWGARGCFPALAVAVVLIAGCGPGPEIEGQSKRPMARQAVEEYLRSMRRGDFETAARYFAGPLESLRRETGREGTPAELLAAYRELPGIYHGAYTLDPVRMIAPHDFAVTVTFEWPGWPDAVTEFRVTYDGQRYVVLGLPPRKAGEPTGDPPASK